MLVQAGSGLRAGLRTAAWRDAVMVAGDGERVAVHRIGAAQISRTADVGLSDIAETAHHNMVSHDT